MSRSPGRLLRILPRGKFARSVAVMTAGTALGQGLVLASAPLLTRLYTPADFGMLAVYGSIVSLVAVVGALRYELAIALPEDDESAANLLLLALILVMVTSLLAGLGVWLLADQLVRLVNTAALKPYLWLVPLGVLGAGIYEALTFWAVRKKAFTTIARTRLTQGAGQVLTQIILGLLKLGPVGLLLGQALGKAGGSGTLATLAWKHDRESIKRISASGMYRAALRYRRFPMLSSSTAVLNYSGLYLPPILLAAFYGPQVAGWFLLGQRVIGLPTMVVGKSVSDVYMGEAAQLVRTDPHALERLFTKTAKRLTLMGAPPLLVLGLVAPWVFALVFGEGWREAGVYAQLMAVAFLAQFVTTPLEATFAVTERQDLGLARHTIRLVLVVGSLSLAHLAKWGPILAIGLYSVSMFVAYMNILVLGKHALRVKQSQWPR
jgi:O-antigen/teichoic acid export membrane protein